ncbi:HD domain-containing protein [Isachenkonia alkalipeptolytica]|uniref:HD domain-containing protein n=1 Tax=Isachenkonia alkalipeptolytica TaxID=2565777 RepID=A0AA44BCL0_9CLOT|nr:HD domain-containing protein [Isachenkonia alkalipeptolytica]NBG87028.1 HD domain-containing protein [Isachenkonia alkalipeptolytica]
MLYRIKQFFRGVFAKVTPEEQVFLKAYLTKGEALLFRRLRVGEQRHSLNIAYDCLKEAPKNRILIKAALLHDVGKINSNLTLVHKALVVVITKLPIPKRMLPKFLQKALYYKQQHPALGAELLNNVGTEASVVFLTRHHHRDFSTNPIPLKAYPKLGEGFNENSLGDLLKTLELLQKIDEKN